MRANFTRAAVAALAVGFAGVSQAIPVQFDFSGTVDDGTRGTGQFIIETDGLVQLAFGGPDYPQKTFTDLLGPQNRPTPILGSFTANSTTYDLGSYLPGGNGNVNFVDVCRPDCLPGWSENWSLSLYQQDFPYASPQPAGGYTYRSLYFISQTPYDIDHTQSFDFLDNSVTRPEDILTLPLLQLGAVFYEETVNCSTGVCSRVRNVEYHVNVDTVTRGVVSTSVPEPGTLTLFAAALAGLFFVRRRATSASTR